MNQYQYQNKNQYDPFAEEEEELQDHEKFHPSSMLMRDLESYARQQEKKKKFRFRMISLVVAAMISLPIAITGRAIMYNFSHRDYVETVDYPDDNVDDYDQYHVYTIEHNDGADEYYDPGDGELGEDPGEPEFLLNGTYYHMPTPLHVFVEDGWNIVYNGYDGKPNGEIAGNWTEYVTLEKDGQYLYSVQLGSPSGETIPIDDSYVLGFSVDRWSEINLELPGGIMIGSEMDEALEAMRNSSMDLEDLDYDYSYGIRGQKRINTYGDFKYWNVTVETYDEEDGLVDWIELDTNSYKY